MSIYSKLEQLYCDFILHGVSCEDYLVKSESNIKVPITTGFQYTMITMAYKCFTLEIKHGAMEFYPNQQSYTVEPNLEK